MIKKILIALLILIVITFAFVKWKVAQINDEKGEFSAEQLNDPIQAKDTTILANDGTVIPLKIAGSGQTVILAHGFGGDIQGWSLVFTELVKRGYQVIAFQQRGHNKSSFGADGISSKSMAGDYNTILESLNVQKGILVGHSMGGFLALKFLIENKETTQNRLAGAMIVSSFAGDINKENAQNKLQIPLFKNGMIEKIMNNETLAVLFQSALIGKPYRAIVDVALKSAKNQNFATLTPILQAFMDENYYDQIKEITIPCTIMVGTLDQTAPKFHSEQLAKDIPNATLVKVEGKGHLLNWEAPATICNEIDKMATN